MAKSFRILAVLFLVVVSFSCSRRGTVVGRFNGDPLTLGAVSAELSREGVPWRKSDLSSRLNAVSNLIIRDLFLLDARKKGYFERQDIKELFDSKKKDLVKAAVLNEVVGVPSVALAAGDIRKYTSIVTCRLIYFNAPVSLDTEYRKNKYNEARDCLRLLKPANFAEMANLYTDYPGNLKGGYLGAVDASGLDPELAGVVPAMKPGDISDVIPVRDGFRIVRLEKVEKSQDGRQNRYSLSSIFLAADPTNRAGALGKARDLWRQIKADPGSFREFANRWSDDPANKCGGLLRPFVFEQMVPSVADAVWRTPRGKVSRLVSDRSGFYIVMVEKIQFRTGRELSDYRKNRQYYQNLKQRILQRKMNKIREARFERYRSRLLSSAKVIRDYSCFTNTTLSDTNAAAVAVLVKVLYNNTVFTYADFLEQLRLQSGRYAGTPSYIEKVSLFENRLLLPELVYADGLKRGYMQTRKFTKDYADFCDNTVFSRYIQDLSDAWPITEGQVKQFYGKNKTRFENIPFDRAAEIVRKQLLREQRPVIVRQKMAELLRVYKLEIFRDKLMSERERALAKLEEKALKAEQAADFAAASAAFYTLVKKRPADLDSCFALYRTASRLPESDQTRRMIRTAVSRAAADIGRLAARLDDPMLRSSALEIMERSGNRGVVPVLVMRLPVSDRQFQIDILRVLGDLKAVNAAGAVVDFLRQARRNVIASSNLPVIQESCAALGRMGSSDSEPWVKDWLSREADYRIQAVLIRGLASFKDPSLVPVFRQYLSSPAPDVRLSASAALASQTNQ